jgi:PPOX class probable F420-dependent enzyme
MNTDAVATDPAARIDGLLRREPVVWVSTVRPDGLPHLVPIWFSWDGERLFIASKPNAVKVHNLRANRTLMLAVGEPDEDFDVGLIEAVATISDRTTAELLPRGHLAKYRRQMAEIGLDADEYVRTYSQPIVVTPTRFLPWHGRTAPKQAGVPRLDSLRGMIARWMRPLRPALLGA